jgi:flagellin
MISINTNNAATAAAYNLNNTNAKLQKSLIRLSSGLRINSSADDAGGLAVAMKMSAAIRRTDATSANVGNAISFLQTQDGVLKNADLVLTRMSELASLATDVTKTSSDLALYQTEATSLTAQLTAMIGETFNGISLFGGSALTVRTSEDATQNMTISKASLTTTTITISSNTGAVAALTTVTAAIQTLAGLRATNGAQQNRLGFAADTLAVNKINLDAAYGRIMDVDVASESTQLARLNILQQAGVAMLAQANQSTQSILSLLT